MTSLSPSGWAVYWWTEAGASLAKTSVQARLYDTALALQFGPLVRIRAPQEPKRGRRQVRIDTITPISIVSTGRSIVRNKPTAECLAGSLTGTWMQRLGCDGLAADDLRIEVVSVAREESVRVPLGGKYGAVPGWEGSFVVEANAPARWLLRVAERTGLGSRTAFGFGQIRLTDVE